MQTKKNKKMMNNKLFFQIALVTGMFAASGCNDDQSDSREVNNEPVELSISPTVSLSRSIIEGDGSTNQTDLGSVAVYASGTDYTAEKNNDYAIYTWSSSSWASGTDNKIHLTNENATIHAHYPAYELGSDGTATATALKATSNAIKVGVQESGTIDASPSSGTLAAVNEVDYMWATAVSGVNNKENNTNVTLAMNHALTRVSFRVYKTSDYHGTGSLTQVVLKNASGASPLDKGTTPTMNITDGTFTLNSPAAATYTRTITNYTLGTDKDAAKQVSMLVFPLNTAFSADQIKAVFTVDDVPYTVSVTLPSETLNGSGNAGKWLPGKNYLYTAKLSGTEFTITTVSVKAWEDKTVDGDLEIK